VTDENNLDDVVEKAVEEATSEENFDALDFFSNATLPSGTVTIYRDTAAAYRINEIRAQVEAAKGVDEDEGLGITDDGGYIDDDEVDELTERLKASAVTFNLQALAPAARTALEKSTRAKHGFKADEENSAYWEAFNANLVAKSIQSVANAKGQKDSNKWDAARVIKFMEVLEPSEWQKLFLKTFELNFVQDAIDRAVSADF
jgi:hypothetical protein